MSKFFFALEKKTLEAYRDSRNEAAEAAPKMSSAEISEWKAELIKTANIRALPEEVESSRFEPPPFFSIDDEGTANIEVSGVLLNFVDFFDFFFDDPITTFGFIREAALRADDDPAVKKIRFNVSTPGGMVDGVDLTSNVIANLKKPTETIGFGMVASAGIWLFSQTDKIIASDPTVFFGSIGVAVTYISRAKMYEEMGIEIIDFTNDDSQDKRPDLSTDHGKQIIIKELNDLFQIFIERVAKGRNVTVGFAKKNFGKGAVLIASDAQKAGLIDQVELQTGTAGARSRQSASADSLNPTQGKTMNEKEFLAFLETNPEAKAFYTDGMAYIKAVADLAPDLTAMSLPDVLALAPQATTEHTAAIAEAGKAVEDNKMSELESKFLVTALASGKYGASVIDCIADSFSGKATYQESKRMIAGADETAALIAAAQLINGQPPATPGSSVNAGDDTNIKGPKIQASIKQLKSELGV